MDARRWDDMLVLLAETTGCIQAALEIFDPVNGPVSLRRPLIAPEFLTAFDSYYSNRSDLRARTERFAPGEIFRSQDIMDLDAVRGSALYNEWWLPQGTGGEVLMTNLVREARATAVLTAVKPARSPAFSASERSLFQLAAAHATRAIAINRRLSLAEAGVNAAGSPAQFIVLDRDARVLSGDPQAHRLLVDSGLIGQGARGELADTVRNSIKMDRASHFSACDREGGPLRIRIVPLRPRQGEWLEIDAPSALLHVERLEDVRRLRARSLQSAYGLTKAEADVALEIGRGDGRSAAAARLGIRPATVRAHLSAIFDKTGVRRQAELARLVQEG